LLVSYRSTQTVDTVVGVGTQGEKLDICTLLLLDSQSLRHDRLTGNEAKLAHPGLTFRLSHTVLEQRVEVAQRDEGRRQDGLLLVLHHHGEPLEHPNLVGGNHSHLSVYFRYITGDNVYF